MGTGKTATHYTKNVSQAKILNHKKYRVTWARHYLVNVLAYRQGPFGWDCPANKHFQAMESIFKFGAMTPSLPCATGLVHTREKGSYIAWLALDSRGG